MAYIDLELLTEKLHKKLVDCSLNKKIKKTLAFIEMCDAIKECPKIDIVQCKDCILHKEGCPLDTHPYMTADEGYCYLGKRTPQERGGEK